MKQAHLNLIIFLTLTAIQAHAQFDYTTNADGALTIIDYFGPSNNVAIPSNINGLSVTVIGNAVFDGFYDLTNVVIASGIANVGEWAFQDCHGLVSLTIPTSITNIGEYAFHNCDGLTNIIIPNGVITVEEGAFQDCTNLSYVSIPASASSIGEGAFEFCSALRSVSIGYGVTSIEPYAFGNSGLTNLTVPATVTNMAWVFEFCSNLTTAIIMSDATEAEGAFYGCSSLTSVALPMGLTNISSSEFADCGGLASVIIPTSATTIGSAAFTLCVGLTNVVIPSAVTNLGDYAFSDSGLLSVFFKGNAPSADSTVFDSDSVVAYYILGTTGWPEFSTNTGVPAVVWNPAIQVNDGSFGVRNNKFGFDITGTINIPIVVEACTNLADPVWVPLQSLILTNGLFYFSETFQPNAAGRLYRISSP